MQPVQLFHVNDNLHTEMEIMVLFLSRLFAGIKLLSYEKVSVENVITTTNNFLLFCTLTLKCNNFFRILILSPAV